MERQIKAILFSDVVGFSGLPEEAMPFFMERFFGGMAKIIDSLEVAPESRNTWGDAIYLVFDKVEHAGQAAIQLRNWVETREWEALGFPWPLRMRVGLHAGPVYHLEDPIRGEKCFMGGHINRAARIEPIVDEGQIFASEEFAALAAADGVTAFACEYQGFAELPKNSGRIPVYLIRSTS